MSSDLTFVTNEAGKSLSDRFRVLLGDYIRAGGDDPKAAINLMLSASSAAFITVPPGEREDLDLVASKIAEAVQRIVRGRVAKSQKGKLNAKTAQH